MPVHVIAEAGVNHNGDMALARRLIDIAAEAGADAVKFQTFRAETLATAAAPKARYQTTTTDAGESQFAMLKKLEIAREEHAPLADHCRRAGIAFLSTPFDIGSLEFLVSDLGLGTVKLPSGEVTNGPFLLAAARSGADIILSTGMSTLGEVEEALAVLAFGCLDAAAVPCRRAFLDAYNSAEGRAALAVRVRLLHCTTEYPTPFADINLRAMDTLAAAFGLPVGLSDHSPGIAVPIAAVARGARLVEKHFTLDKAMAGPDHRASLDPAELAAMIAGIRAVEAALGNGIKTVQPSEMENRRVVRKSLVAAHPIAAGHTMAADDLAVKRPGTGLSPMAYWDVLGRPASRNYAADTLIEE
jgi:N-acetylneuraminate synthase